MPPIDLTPAPAQGEAERFDRAFARAAGAALTSRNTVRLLLDARENFPAWLAAIEAAQRYILFESYIIADDRVGRAFTEALAKKARAGVLVYVVYDWLGSTKFGRTWDVLRAASADVRCFNPPSLDSPLAWLTRDHRKSIVVDGEVGFVSGLCISEKWEGDPKARLEPWRDTGVELRGDSVLELESAFDQVWKACGGTPLTFDHATLPAVDGTTRVRVIAGVPSGAGMYRTDLLVASTAKKTLWLTDAYFIATAAYTQALQAAARDGVDVRLLVPGASDIPAVSPLSRSGYRSLLEAGVRVFEWNGTMLHAKSAVADGVWSRVGSTNLNLASWLSNYELDVAIEDIAFAKVMAWQYEQDLARATEIVLTKRNRVRRTDTHGPAEVEHGARRAMSGSAGRAAAGAVSVGSALGAALTNRRTLGPAEAGLLATMAVVFVAVAVLAVWFPYVIAMPIAILAGWMGVSWGVKGWHLWRKAPPPPVEPSKTAPAAVPPLDAPASSERKG